MSEAFWLAMVVVGFTAGYLLGVTLGWVGGLRSGLRAKGGDDAR